ncbi:type I-E CRISPR-associated protein Cse1/CasA [Streptomyces sp. NBC_01727]|uniref:type I-E CRISPR-associated protein Cse1/CasA n=1 Tax=Streptomyces sp. NBC_01727 TaxID=2975924 RepID=UPI002E0FC2BC|nr:type I-E CRISPR-associated protein Cse1/CasA [Streptomyces sp. NBC_01727]
MTLSEIRPSPAGELRPRWDPRRQACIPALTTAGVSTTVTLVHALRHANDLLGVSGTTAGETVALIEYLLAVCYASGTCPATVDDWLNRIHDSSPLTDAAEWLESRPDEHWDLFHPVEPLGQNALLAPYLDEHGAGPAQLVIEHAGDYNQFFDHHHLEHPVPLPADAAFRAMLTQHAYGPGGRARISGKETLGPTLTNLAAGRLGTRLRVIALGETLGDTLRLNLIPTNDAPGRFNRTWTVAPEPRRGFLTKPSGRRVDGPADLHTVLGRSILMRPAVTEDGQPAVDRVLLAAGELLEPLAPHHMQDAVYEQAPKGEVKPLRPSSSRALWLEAHALYAAVADRDHGPDLYDRLARLSGRRLNLWTVGLIAKQTTVVTWVSDTFPFVPGRERDLRYAAERGSLVAEYVASSLSRAAYVAWTVTYPNPKPADKSSQIARFDARPEHWAHTEEPFHMLLDDTAAAESDEQVDAALVEYAAVLAEAAGRFLRNRLDSLPANSRGYQAHAQALRRLENDLTGPKAPDELKGERK